MNFFKVGALSAVLTIAACNSPVATPDASNELPDSLNGFVIYGDFPTASPAATDRYLFSSSYDSARLQTGSKLAPGATAAPMASVSLKLPDPKVTECASLAPFYTAIGLEKSGTPGRVIGNRLGRQWLATGRRQGGLVEYTNASPRYEEKAGMAYANDDRSITIECIDSEVGVIKESICAAYVEVVLDTKDGVALGGGVVERGKSDIDLLSNRSRCIKATLLSISKTGRLGAQRNLNRATLAPPTLSAKR